MPTAAGSASACGPAPRPRPNWMAHLQPFARHRTPPALPVDPTVRKEINEGRMQYVDIHLSHVAQYVWFGFLGHLDVAVVEVAGILPDGRLIPSTSVGNNKTLWSRPTRSFWKSTAPSPPRWKACTTSTTARPCPPLRKPIPMVHPYDALATLPALRSGQGDRRGAHAAA